MQFIVLNEYSIQKYNIQEKHIVISIRSPNTDYVKLPESDSRVAALFLDFSDIDRKIDHPTAKLFTEEQAEAIWNFFNFYKHKINTVICQCEAGISRSSAIAAALAKSIEQNNDRFFHYYLPNHFVYSQILKIIYKNEKT